MDELKQQIMKARKKYKIGPQHRDESISCMQQAYDLDNLFKHRYVSEELGLPAMFTQKCQFPAYSPVHTFNIKEDPQMIVLKHPKTAIKEFKRQYFNTLSQPKWPNHKPGNKSIPMQIQIKVKQKKPAKNQQNKQIQPKQPQGKPLDRMMQIELKKSAEAQVIKKMQELEVNSEQHQIDYEKKDVNISLETQTLPLTLPTKDEPQTSASQTIYTMSSYHNEDSIWKKYLVMDQHPSSPLSTRITPQTLQPSHLSPKRTQEDLRNDKQPIYNESMGFLRNTLLDQEIIDQTSARKKSKKNPKIDLLQKEQMKNLYEGYNPVLFPQQQISLLIKALDSVEQQLCGVEFLDQVYVSYKKSGGTMKKSELQLKIVSDLLFVIRQQNIKVWNHTQIE